MAPLVRLLRLSQVPILRQLRLEEALLRTDAGNWCLLNDGSAVPTVVMGISGQPEELVHTAAARQAGVQLVKRFTGGGTVVVDPDTVFATLILQAEAVSGLECYPRPIMRWTEQFYARVFSPYGPFALRENDYVFGERKFGGNAQAITKQRWLHHTSLLWDFDDRRMALLKHPSRAPDYRQGRDHLEFVCRLRELLPGVARAQLLAALAANLGHAGFAVQEVGLEEAEQALAVEHLRNTRVVD